MRSLKDSEADFIREAGCFLVIVPGKIIPEGDQM
jgi:hypothetical protein